MGPVCFLGGKTQVGQANAHAQVKQQGSTAQDLTGMAQVTDGGVRVRAFVHGHTLSDHDWLERHPLAYLRHMWIA